MLPRGRSIFRTAKGCSIFIRGATSRTGRISTCEPGRKADAPPRSTVKPPLTRPTMAPLTGSFLSNAFSSLSQLSSRRALSREMTASPSAFSIRSRKTSISSPGFGAVDPGPVNSRSEIRPSVFRPTSTVTKSFSTAVTRPLMTEPSARSRPAKLASSIWAKSSRDGDAVSVFVIVWGYSRVFALYSGRPVGSGGLAAVWERT